MIEVASIECEAYEKRKRAREAELLQLAKSGAEAYDKLMAEFDAGIAMIQRGEAEAGLARIKAAMANHEEPDAKRLRELLDPEPFPVLRAGSYFTEGMVSVMLTVLYRTVIRAAGGMRAYPMLRQFRRYFAH